MMMLVMMLQERPERLGTNPIPGMRAQPITFAQGYAALRIWYTAANGGAC